VDNQGSSEEKNPVWMHKYISVHIHTNTHTMRERERERDFKELAHAILEINKYKVQNDGEDADWRPKKEVCVQKQSFDRILFCV
jgi:hypothetical protein